VTDQDRCQNCPSRVIVQRSGSRSVNLTSCCRFVREVDKSREVRAAVMEKRSE